MISLPRATPEKKMASPFPRRHHLPIGPEEGLEEHEPLLPPCWDVGVVLCRLPAGLVQALCRFYTGLVLVQVLHRPCVGLVQAATAAGRS